MKTVSISKIAPKATEYIDCAVELPTGEFNFKVREVAPLVDVMKMAVTMKDILFTEEDGAVNYNPALKDCAWRYGVVSTYTNIDCSNVEDVYAVASMAKVWDEISHYVYVGTAHRIMNDVIDNYLRVNSGAEAAGFKICGICDKLDATMDAVIASSANGEAVMPELV